MGLIDILPQDDVKRMLAQVDRVLAQAEARGAQAEQVMTAITRLIDNLDLLVIRAQEIVGARKDSV